MKIQAGDRVTPILTGWINQSTKKPPYAPNGLPIKGKVYYVESVRPFPNDPNHVNIYLLGYPIYNDGDSIIEGGFHSMCFEKLPSRSERAK